MFDLPQHGTEAPAVNGISIGSRDFMLEIQMLRSTLTQL